MCKNQLMKMTEVADEAQIPIRTIYYLNQMGRGPKTVSVGRHLRVRRSDYEAWLTSSGN
jgi:predicted DNA-binding transcriptional regulator AlpA